jgi:hypothetical protein
MLFLFRVRINSSCFHCFTYNRGVIVAFTLDNGDFFLRLDVDNVADRRLDDYFLFLLGHVDNDGASYGCSGYTEDELGRATRFFFFRLGLTCHSTDRSSDSDSDTTTLSNEF